MIDLLSIIRERQSTRVVFDSKRPVAREDIESILEAGRWTPSAHNMQNFELIVIDDKKTLKAISDIRFTMTDTFVKENYKNLSFSEEELKKRKTGLLGTIFPPILRTPGDMIDAEIHKKIDSWWGKIIKNAIQKSPVLVVMVYDPRKRAPDSEGDFLGIVSLGCALENMWLMATFLGIGFQVMSVLGEISAEKEVKEILNIPKSLKVALGFRLGYPLLSTNYARVRRDSKDIIHHNRYDNRALI